MTPERVSNSRHNPHTTFNILFYITHCNHNILGTPFYKEHIETIKANTNKLTINTSTNIENDIIFFQNTTKEYPYYSRVYPVYNKETQYFEPHELKCLPFPIPIFERMEKSNEKILYGSLHYFEPINKYHNLSFTDIKDLTKGNENFAEIYLINKNKHKMILKIELIVFIYQNTTFKVFHMQIYHTNSSDLFSALYHLTSENGNDFKEILQIQIHETINQVAKFERKPNFKCKFNITKNSDKDKEFIQKFDFQQSHLTQEQFDKVVEIILKYKNVYATTKFDVGKQR